mmetsp:Transcript_11934/g.29386  ORF Transcript_11934/g.29386 Transcript_11934/m.29386 type:complete len:452 (-) Transcript_11934:70-1425(-)
MVDRKRGGPGGQDGSSPPRQMEALASSARLRSVTTNPEIAYLQRRNNILRERISRLEDRIYPHKNEYSCLKLTGFTVSICALGIFTMTAFVQAVATATVRNMEDRDNAENALGIVSWIYACMTLISLIALVGSACYNFLKHKKPSYAYSCKEKGCLKLLSSCFSCICRRLSSSNDDFCWTARKAILVYSDRGPYDEISYAMRVRKALCGNSNKHIPDTGWEVLAVHSWDQVRTERGMNQIGDLQDGDVPRGTQELQVGNVPVNIICLRYPEEQNQRPLNLLQLDIKNVIKFCDADILNSTKTVGIIVYNVPLHCERWFDVSLLHQVKKELQPHQGHQRKKKYIKLEDLEEITDPSIILSVNSPEEKKNLSEEKKNLRRYNIPMVCVIAEDRHSLNGDFREKIKGFVEKLKDKHTKLKEYQSSKDEKQASSSDRKNENTMNPASASYDGKHM